MEKTLTLNQPKNDPIGSFKLGNKKRIEFIQNVRKLVIAYMIKNDGVTFITNQANKIEVSQLDARSSFKIDLFKNCNIFQSYVEDDSNFGVLTTSLYILLAWYSGMVSLQLPKEKGEKVCKSILETLKIDVRHIVLELDAKFASAKNEKVPPPKEENTRIAPYKKVLGK